MSKHATSHVPATMIVASGFLVCALLLIPASVVFGQAAEQPAYQTLPINDLYKSPSMDGVDMSDRNAVNAANKARRTIEGKRRELEREFSDILEGRQSGTSGTTMEDWFNGYVFPSMTQTDDESLELLGKRRSDFFRNYMNDTPTGGLRSRLLDSLTFPKMKEVAEGNFHPAARVNAMIVIGRLNSQEGQRNASLPVPYQPAFAYLLQAYSAPNQEMYLKVPILAGLERHASLQGATTANPMDDGPRGQLADLMVNIITTDPAADTPPEIAYLLKRRAVRTLGYLEDPGAGGRYAKVLRDVIANEDLGIWIRVDALQAYSRLDFAADSSLAESTDIAKKVAALVIWAAKNDAEYIEERIDEIRLTAMFLDGKDVSQTGTGGGQEDPGLGRGGNAEDPSGGGRQGPSADEEVPEVLPEYQREQVRRRFKSIAWAGRVVLVGKERFRPKGGLSELFDETSEENQLIQELATKINEMMVTTDVKPPSEDDEPEEDDDENSPFGKKKEKKLSLADQLKMALLDGADSLQMTLDKHNAAQPAAGDASTTDPATGDSGN